MLDRFKNHIDTHNDGERIHALLVSRMVGMFRQQAAEVVKDRQQLEQMPEDVAPRTRGTLIKAMRGVERRLQSDIGEMKAAPADDRESLLWMWGEYTMRMSHVVTIDEDGKPSFQKPTKTRLPIVEALSHVASGRNSLEDEPDANERATIRRAAVKWLKSDGGHHVFALLMNFLLNGPRKPTGKPRKGKEAPGGKAPDAAMGTGTQQDVLKMAAKDAAAESVLCRTGWSSSTNSLLKGIINVNQEDSLILSQRAVDRHSRVVYEDSVLTLVTGRGKEIKSLTMVNMDVIAKTIGRGGNIARFLIYILSKANEKYNAETKQLVSYEIMISNREVMDMLGYKSLASAHVAASRALRAIYHTEFAGYRVWGNGKKKWVGEVMRPLIYPGKPHNGIYPILLDKELDWSFLSEFIISFPKSILRLKEKPMLLGVACCIRLRNELKNVARAGHATITLRTLSMYMGLPHESKCTKATTQIKKPIEKAITDLEALDLRESCLQITPDYSRTSTGDATAPIADYLDNGRLIIHPMGELADNLLSTAERNNSVKHKAIERRRAIKKKAAIQAAANAQQ